jgi:hypothetical protein
MPHRTQRTTPAFYVMLTPSQCSGHAPGGIAPDYNVETMQQISEMVPSVHHDNVFYWVS